MDRKLEKKRWSAKRIAYLAGGAAALALALHALILGGRARKLDVDADRVTVFEVVDGEFQEFIAVTGTVVPIRTHYLDAVEGGTVDTVYVEAGSFVESGDRILKLANTSLLLDVMYREAELFQQSNNLRNTKLDMARHTLEMRGQLLDLMNRIRTQRRTTESNAALAEKALIPRREYEESIDELAYLEETLALTRQMHRQDSLFCERQIAQLETSLGRIEGNLEILRRNMESLVLRAPVAGHLTSLDAEIGQSKARGERLGQIDVLDGFKVMASIDEHYIARVDPGQKASFALSEDSFTLSVDKVYPEVVNGRFEVELLFDGDEPEGVRRGQTLRIRLELGELSAATLLAKGGFYQGTGGRWVYVLDASGETATKRPIQLGRENTMYYEVLDGLAAGEKVVTSSYDGFGDADVLILEANGRAR